MASIFQTAKRQFTIWKQMTSHSLPEEVHATCKIDKHVIIKVDLDWYEMNLIQTFCQLKTIDTNYFFYKKNVEISLLIKWMFNFKEMFWRQNVWLFLLTSKYKWFE